MENKDTLSRQWLIEEISVVSSAETIINGMFEIVTSVALIPNWR